MDRQRLNGNSDGDRWDAIVIGSGLGGLSTAAYLATNGLRTIVLEQYDVAGGCSHVFRRKNEYEFDVGLHYIGDCGEQGPIPTAFRGLGLDGKVEFLELDPDGFDTLVFPDFEFRVPRGWDRYLGRLIETFPDEAVGLQRCVATLEGIGGELRGPALSSSVTDLERLARESPTLFQWGLRTLAELFEECRLSQRAQAVLAGESGDHATPPSRCAVAVHAGLLDHYIRGGAYYPRGGGQVLAAHLVDVIRSHGSVVRTHARVEEIMIEGGRTQGVRLRGGETLSAPIVVSNADIKRTFLELIERGHLSDEAAARAEGFKMASPLFCVYLGVDIDLADHMPNTQYWCHPSYDFEEFYRRCDSGELPESFKPEDQFAYITSASLKDPYTAEIAPPGHSSLEIMTLVPPDYGAWGITSGPAAGERYRRRAHYRDVKERLTDALIERADQMIPGLKDHVVWKEAATPITQERYTLSSDGASYGLEFTPAQVGPNRPGPVTDIEGLYLAGASTVFGHGIAGTIRGGVGTASAILERDLFAEVRGGKVFGDPSKLSGGGEDWDPLEACRRLSVKSRSGRVSPVVA